MCVWLRLPTYLCLCLCVSACACVLLSLFARADPNAVVLKKGMRRTPLDIAAGQRFGFEESTFRTMLHVAGCLPGDGQPDAFHAARRAKGKGKGKGKDKGKDEPGKGKSKGK